MGSGRQGTMWKGKGKASRGAEIGADEAADASPIRRRRLAKGDTVLEDRWGGGRTTHEVGPRARVRMNRRIPDQKDRRGSALDDRAGTDENQSPRKNPDGPAHDGD